MLYISRFRFNPEDDAKSFDEIISIGVVDTDDGTETFVVEKRLVTLIQDYGLHIEGMQLGDTDLILPVVSLVPYQLPETYTTHQIKTKVLHGVDVRVYNGEITAILIDDSVTQDGIRLRLSEFGTSVSSTCVVKWLNTVDFRPRQLTLVFDNNIKLIDELLGMHGSGVYLDISEVTDEDFMGKVLESIPKLDNLNLFWRDYVIDTQNRLRG